MVLTLKSFGPRTIKITNMHARIISCDFMINTSIYFWKDLGWETHLGENQPTWKAMVLILMII
jgi:hypothetical protein